MDHQLSLLSDGQYTCALCQQKWRAQPRSSCVYRRQRGGQDGRSAFLI
jgi:hypothetical protein